MGSDSKVYEASSSLSTRAFPQRHAHVHHGDDSATAAGESGPQISGDPLESSMAVILIEKLIDDADN